MSPIPAATAQVPLRSTPKVLVLPYALVARDQLMEPGIEQAPRGQVQFRLVIGQTRGHPDQREADLTTLDLAAGLYEHGHLEDHDRLALCIAPYAGQI